MKKSLLKVVGFGLMFSPVFAFAQTGGSYLGNTTGILTQIAYIVSELLIPIAFALALLYFFWGVAKYVRSEGEGKEDGKRIMVWGVVALFVMASIWGIVRFISDEIGVSSYGTSSGTIQVPNISQ